MSKPHPERPSETERSVDAPPLSPGIRRHLGQNLRTLLTDTLSAPVDQRLEALIDRLGKPKR
ncbi:hypothetical protein ABID82_005730 [Methylobacterium sp. PvP062]|jgi:hypothetical protein|uniref:Anti-sigma factor NepR domain-containing protein n=2 Tax=Methylobacterium radiotolerans TaxID=31998 RepID=B1M0Y4_METRJ|nr:MULTISPECIES: hypothetical protein [Methylobacterium]MBE7204049.1 hypothetical protein [Parafilimonas terrae]MCX7330295.1 hypothetical protein [Hyphomicrobiales bacterium]ACB23104.1 conserved hypothetical protein [Methylobacterium radiotolerans JCM 2831]KIU36606.1 hypothetical protein SR39_05780 [Methylobacterium radiotolerans]KTS03883.1 hypothetical protein SB3_25390 [Methylobacterium radiotolerans]